MRRASPAALIAGLTSTTMTAATRRGKYLVCPLDSGDAVMLHLRMSGQLLLGDPAAPRPPHTHVVIHLAPDDSHAGADLLFVDARTFGEVVVFDPANAAVEVPELARLGLDPIADPFTVANLRAGCAAARPGSRPCSSTSTCSPASATSTRTRSCTGHVSTRTVPPVR